MFWDIFNQKLTNTDTEAGAVSKIAVWNRWPMEACEDYKVTLKFDKVYL